MYYLLTTPGSWREVLRAGITPVIKPRPEAIQVQVLHSTASCFSNSLCPLCSVPVHGRNVVSHHLSLRLNLSNLSLLSGQFVLVVFWSSRNKSAHKFGILHFLACYPPTNFSPNTLSLFVSSVKPYFTTSITIYTITVLLMSRRDNFDT